MFDFRGFILNLVVPSSSLRLHFPIKRKVSCIVRCPCPTSSTFTQFSLPSSSSEFLFPQNPPRNSIRCNFAEQLRILENGKPSLIGMEPPFSSFSASPKHFVSDLNRNDTRLQIFSGTANPALSQEIACYMGLELGKIKIKWFADGEIYVQLQESVRGCDVYLVQPTCPPANESLMELSVMIDACRRASAKTITAVIPYFGYPRADRKVSLSRYTCRVCRGW